MDTGFQAVAQSESQFVEKLAIALETALTLQNPQYGIETFPTVGFESFLDRDVRSMRTGCPRLSSNQVVDDGEVARDGA